MFAPRLMTQDEFILPLCFENKSVHDDMAEETERGHQSTTLKRALSNTQTLSIRPELKFTEDRWVWQILL